MSRTKDMRIVCECGHSGSDHYKSGCCKRCVECNEFRTAVLVTLSRRALARLARSSGRGAGRKP